MPEEIPRLFIKFTDIFQMIEADGKIVYVKLLVNEDGTIKVDRDAAENEFRAKADTQPFPTLTNIPGISEQPTEKLVAPPLTGIPSLSTE
jgi:hypothetical protein